MTLPRTTRKFIETQNFEAVEDEWLARLEEPGLDLDYFTSTARALAATDGEDQARQLLELLDEQIISNSLWEERLLVLEATGEISYEIEKMQKQILATLKKLYPESQVVQNLSDRVGLDKAIEDVPKTWQKVRRLRGLLNFDVGSIVAMEGKGVGRVVQVNVQLEKIKVDFQSHAGLTVGFGAAAKVLEPLPPDHFLRRKIEEPDALGALAKDDPQELLRLILTSQPDQTATQLKVAVKGLVADKSWTSWWARARTHPQVVSSGKGARQTYRWADSAAAAGEEVVKQFAKADLKQQLDIFLREVKRNPEAASELAAILRQTADKARKKDPSTAIAVASALEKSGLNLPQPDWTIDDLLRDSREAPKLLRGLTDKSLRLAALERLPELREDWPQIFSTAITQETDSTALGLLFDKLWSDARDLAEELVDRALSQPAKQPAAFLWILAHIDSHPYFGTRNPARALSQLFRAPGLPQFAPFRSAIKKVMSQGEVTAALINRLELEHVEVVQELFERSAIEEYLRNRLLTALHMRFPEFRSSSSEALYATTRVIDQKRIELKTLLEVEIPANRRAIEEARAMGDLRENFEYKSARQRHEYLSARVSALERDLERAQPIGFENFDTTEVRIGATIELAGPDDAKRSLTVLGPWESNPDDGILSYESEAGGRLLGKKPGDEVEVGQETWQVQSIAPYEGPDSQ